MKSFSDFKSSHPPFQSFPDAISVHPSRDGWPVLAVEGSFPVFPEGTEPDVLLRQGAPRVPVVASKSLCCSDVNPPRSPVDGAGVAGRHLADVIADVRFINGVEEKETGRKAAGLETAIHNIWP